LPINRGFDSHFGFLKGGEDHYNQGSGSMHGIKGTVDLWSGHALSNETGVYSGYLYSTKAVQVIEKFASDTRDQVARGETPATGLFMYLAWHNTHLPLECPAEWMYPAYYNNSFPARMTYNCMSRILDDGIGNVTVALKEAGLWDDTLLFFAADNGGWAEARAGDPSGASNYPLRGSKTSDFEGGIRAVSFLNGGKNVLPDNVRGGHHTGYISIADWYGTLLTMVGVDPTDNVPNLPPVDSNNFWPSILTANATTSGRDELWLAWSCVGDVTKNVTGCGDVQSIYNTTGDPTAGQNKDDMGYIAKNWKIVIGQQNKRGIWFGPVYPNGTADGVNVECVSGCLFDIWKDPTEHHNVKDAEPAVWKMMLGKLLAAGKTLYQTDYGEPGVTCISGEQAAKMYVGHNTCIKNVPGYNPSWSKCDPSVPRKYLGPMCFKDPLGAE
jgi:arylsulfatase I/J